MKLICEVCRSTNIHTEPNTGLARCVHCGSTEISIQEESNEKDIRYEDC